MVLCCWCRPVYDLNPVGSCSIFAVFAVVLLTTLTSPLFVASALKRRSVVSHAPFVLLLLIFPAACTPMAYGDASVAIGGFILMSFGFGFALWNFRLLTPGCRTVGSVFTFIFGAMILLSALTYLDSWTGLPASQGYGAAGLGGLLWLGLVIVLNHKYGRLWRWQQDPSVCSVCGYSLNGLPEQRCPECGEPFEELGASSEKSDAGCGQVSL